MTVQIFGVCGMSVPDIGWWFCQTPKLQRRGEGAWSVNSDRHRASVSWPKRTIMLKCLAGLVMVILGVGFPTFANAVCVCQCVDGQVRAACTSSFDISPICSLRPCPFGPTLTPPPIGSMTSCTEVRSCDPYGSCTWKRVCPGDKPDAR